MPPQIAPYHLRLDWLMWFAALSSYEEQPWFAPFMEKLLEGDRAVLSLLRTNPFPRPAAALRPGAAVRISLHESGGARGDWPVVEAGIGGLVLSGAVPLVAADALVGLLARLGLNDDA